MNNKVDIWIDEHKQPLIESLQESIRIPSVEGTPVEGAPFGVEVGRALDHALETAKELGLKAESMDGYVGLIEYGEGNELLGVICHMDVVPEGTGWKRPPYGAVIEDGLLFGRGTLDDKGPAFASIYALAAIKAAGIPLRRRVRIILGTNEETGWGGMNYYKEHGEHPTLAFSPDAEYPVVNSEKGIFHSTFKKEFNSNIRIEAGSRHNVVPGRTEVTVPFNAASVRDACEAVLPKLGFSYEITEKEGCAEVVVIGLDAHASMPDSGKNSLQAALAMLTVLPLEDEDAEMVRGLHYAVRMDCHGEAMGLDKTDESGRLTMNPGIMHWDENGISAFGIDVRHPISLSGDEVKGIQRSVLGKLGMELIYEHAQPGHFVSTDSELVSKLLKVYANRAGEYLPPLAIGGGTYARAFENAVAFGCERPGVPAPVHMPNEFISIEDLMFNAHMIADAILALAE